MFIAVSVKENAFSVIITFYTDEKLSLTPYKDHDMSIKEFLFTVPGAKVTGKPIGSSCFLEY